MPHCLGPAKGKPVTPAKGPESSSAHGDGKPDKDKAGKGKAAPPVQPFMTKLSDDEPAAKPGAGGGAEAAAGNGEWTREELSDRRVDPTDGGFYTRAEFVEFYGGKDEWYAAKFAAPCDFFRKGKCHNGGSCKFRHDTANASTSKPAKAQAPPPRATAAPSTGGWGEACSLPQEATMPPPPALGWIQKWAAIASPLSQ